MKTEKKLNPVLQTAVILGGLFVAIFLMSIAINSLFLHTRGPQMFLIMEDFLQLKILIASLSTVILAYLLYNYISVYNKIKSEFSLGLIVVVIALLAHALTDNPLLPLQFGLRGAGLGPFNLIPSVFTFVAAIVLLYLSRK